MNTRTEGRAVDRSIEMFYFLNVYYWRYKVTCNKNLLLNLLGENTTNEFVGWNSLISFKTFN